MCTITFHRGQIDRIPTEGWDWQHDIHSNSQNWKAPFKSCTNGGYSPNIRIALKMNAHEVLRKSILEADFSPSPTVYMV